MQIGPIEWKKKGKTDTKLHGVFPFQPTVRRRDDMRVKDKPTYEIIVNGHVIKVGLLDEAAAARFVEDWLFSAIQGLGQNLGSFLRTRREQEFNNGVSS